MELRETQVHGVAKERSGSVNQPVDAKRWWVGALDFCRRIIAHPVSLRMQSTAHAFK